MIDMKKFKIYFANDLFNEATRDYNEKVVAKIREKFENTTVYSPMENLAINDKEGYADSKTIALSDTKELTSSDLLIAVLDGQTIDVGVASEIGVAYQARIPIIGLYTDTRQQGSNNTRKIEALSHLGESQFSYVNLYTVGLIKLNGVVTSNIGDMLLEIERIITLVREETKK